MEESLKIRNIDGAHRKQALLHCGATQMVYNWLHLNKESSRTKSLVTPGNGNSKDSTPLTKLTVQRFLPMEGISFVVPRTSLSTYGVPLIYLLHYQCERIVMLRGKGTVEKERTRMRLYS
ncbi:unnamed protein product [Cylicocyclus nassatus]|uniref:Uncharacterized protein n=1 Tax=Cylicocyclus nassatus TaxID=53992 RepID=A0AA36HE50_CYLNA|nr:unnamed protein product [Cylicocyclus nassatus]